jgi:hypothetical protein
MATSALAGIAVERELGDHENGSPDLGQRQVHLAVIVGKQPEPGDLGGHPNGIFASVAVGEPDQQAIARADSADFASVDGDRGFGHTLQHYAHGNN